MQNIAIVARMGSVLSGINTSFVNSMAHKFSYVIYWDGHSLRMLISWIPHQMVYIFISSSVLQSARSRIGHLLADSKRRLKRIVLCATLYESMGCPVRRIEYKSTLRNNYVCAYRKASNKSESLDKHEPREEVE